MQSFGCSSTAEAVGSTNDPSPYSAGRRRATRSVIQTPDGPGAAAAAPPSRPPVVQAQDLANPSPSVSMEHRQPRAEEAKTGYDQGACQSFENAPGYRSPRSFDGKHDTAPEGEQAQSELHLGFPRYCRSGAVVCGDVVQAHVIVRGAG